MKGSISNSKHVLEVMRYPGSAMRDTSIYWNAAKKAAVYHPLNNGVPPAMVGRGTAST